MCGAFLILGGWCQPAGKRLGQLRFPGSGETAQNHEALGTQGGSEAEE